MHKWLNQFKQSDRFKSWGVIINMKNKAIKLVSSVLIFVMLSVGSFSLPSYAISTSCVNEHFSRLVTTGSVDYNNLVIRTPPSEETCPYPTV